MPNHITTVATVTGAPERVEAFRVAHILPSDKGEDYFSFESIIPVPACVEDSEASSIAEEGFFALTGMTTTKFAAFAHGGMRYFQARQAEGFEVNQLTTPEHLRQWLAEKHPDVIAAGEKMLRCFRETGQTSWYEWKIEHWGTKWGAYSYEPRPSGPGRLVFKFETAWSPPRPILVKLAAMWPELRIETGSIDEGGGAWAGSGGQVERTEETRELHLAVYGHTKRIDPDPEGE